MDRLEIGLSDVDWTDQAQDKVQVESLCEHDNEFRGT
jgi:hypothetical protein